MGSPVISDDDLPGVRVSESGNRSIAIEGDSDSLTFTPEGWDQAQRIELVVPDDDEAPNPRSNLCRARHKQDYLVDRIMPRRVRQQLVFPRIQAFTSQNHST